MKLLPASTLEEKIMLDKKDFLAHSSTKEMTGLQEDFFFSVSRGTNAVNELLVASL